MKLENEISMSVSGSEKKRERRRMAKLAEAMVYGTAIFLMFFAGKCRRCMHSPEAEAVVKRKY